MSAAPPQPLPPPSREKNFAPLAAVSIVAAGLLAYCNSFGGPFVFDDPASIADNPTIRRLWPIWGALKPPHGQGITVEGRPVLNFSLAMNHAIGGTSVGSYHAMNLAIHILAGLTLFGIVRRTLKPGSATGPAFAVALLWTVHPLQTESVTYVIQRAESLMGLFYFLTLYGFIRWVESETPARSAAQRVAWGALSVVACFLGMGTKEVMATAPLVVFLYDRSFLAGSFREALRLRWRYYVALVASWALLAVLIVGAGGNRSGSVGFGAGPWFAYFLTQLPAIVHYLRLVVWPNPLVFDYGTSWVSHPIQILPQALLVLALGAGTLWALRFRPAVGFLGACFFLVLAPTSLVPGTTQMIVEHRMYVPSAAAIGVLVASAFTAAGLKRVRLITGALTCVAAGLAAVTFSRNAVYATEIGLWSDTVAKRHASADARVNLGISLRKNGRTAEAIAQFEEALRIKPDDAEAHNSLGLALHGAGRSGEATAQFEQALQARPDFAEARNNLGLAFAETGQIAEAISQFEQALRIKPEYAEAHNNLGLALAGIGRTAQAVDEYKEALRIKPDYPEALNNIGLALLAADRSPEAVPYFQEALSLAPGDPRIHFNFGIALGAVGRNAEAIAHYEEALRIKPDYAKAHVNLGNALHAAGRYAEAQAQFEAADRLGAPSEKPR